MIEERQGAPYGVLLAVVVVLVLVGPTLLGDQGAAMTEFIAEFLAELLSPVNLFLLPIVLLLTIQFLSSDRGSFISGIFSTGEPNSIGSPFGGALVLVLVLFLLYNRVSNNGGGDEDFEE